MSTAPRRRMIIRSLIATQALALVAGVAVGAWAMTDDGAYAQSATGDAAPIGALAPFAGQAASIPTGWLAADGSAVSRTTYAALFAAVCPANPAGSVATGTADCPWGTASASTFNLPDIRGRAPVGQGTNANVDVLGEDEGATEANRKGVTLNAHGHSKGSISVNSSGGHAHNFGAITQIQIGGGACCFTAGPWFGWTNVTYNSNSHTHPTSDFSGMIGNTAVNADSDTRLNYLTANYIIKAAAN